MSGCFMRFLVSLVLEDNDTLEKRNINEMQKYSEDR